MKKMFHVGVAILGIAAGAVSSGWAVEEPARKTEMEGLKGRLEQLEKAVEEGKKGVLGAWADKITFSGALSVETSYENLDRKETGSKDEETSDISLASAELGVDIDVMKHVKGRILFLWEEDDTEPVDLDEGFILLDGADVLPFYLKAGKMYVPFGKYETGMISDPLTLELGETRETAVELGVAYQGFYGAVYGFNGDIDEEGSDDTIDTFGASLGYQMERENWSIDIGVGYINNVYDSDGLTGAMEDSIAEGESLGFSVFLREDVPGMAAYALVGAGPFTLIGEYVAMLEDTKVRLAELTPGALADLGLGETSEADALHAWNLEIDYAFTLAEKEAHVCLAWQGVTNAEEGFPEHRYMAAAGVGIFENTGVAVEYCHDEYENDDKADVLTAQLEITF